MWFLTDFDESEVAALDSLSSDISENKQILNKKLHEADTPEIVDILLSEEADVNNLNSFGETPLHSALTAGRKLDVVKALLSGGANVNAKVKYCNYSALHLAQTEEILKELLSRGADINAVNYKEETPLHAAVAAGRDLPCIKELSSAGLNVNAELAYSKLTALHQAKTKDVVNELMAHGADANLVNSFQGTPLHFAISNNRDISVIKALLSGGANPNALITGTKQTALHIATTEEIANELLLYGADINKKDINGETPLLVAVRHSREGVVKALLSGGAEVNAVKSDKSTPLHYAETAEIVDMLLSCGANVNACDFDGETPLVSGLYAGINSDIVKILLSSGADVRGHTVLHKRMCPEIANLLISYGADVDEKDQDQNSALHAVLESAEAGATDVGRLLLKYGANTKTKNALGVSPIDYARDSKNDEMVIELLKYGVKYSVDAFLDCIDDNTETSKSFVKMFVLTHHDYYKDLIISDKLLCRATSVCGSCHDWITFMKKCDQEVIELKKYIIFPNFSLFNLVTIKPVKQLRFVEIRTAEIVPCFPIYQDIIEEALRLSSERTLLFDTFNELSLCSILEGSGNHVVLNLDCMNCIATYLKDHEILKFITAMNSSSYKSKFKISSIIYKNKKTLEPSEKIC